MDSPDSPDGPDFQESESAIWPISPDNRESTDVLSGYEDSVGWNSVYSDLSTSNINMETVLIGGDTTLYPGTVVTNDEVERRYLDNSEPIYGQSQNCITRDAREIMSTKTAPSSARERNIFQLIDGEEPSTPGYSNITETGGDHSLSLSDEPALNDVDPSSISLDSLFENVFLDEDALNLLQATGVLDIPEVIRSDVPSYVAPVPQLRKVPPQQTPLQQASTELFQLQPAQLQPSQMQPAQLLPEPPQQLVQLQPSQMQPAQLLPEPSQMRPALLLPVVLQQPPMQQVPLQEAPLQQTPSSLQEPVKKRRPGRPRKQPTNAESTQQKLDTNQEVFTERRGKSESIKKIHGMVLEELESGALGQEWQFQEDGLLRKRPRKAPLKMKQDVNFDSPQDPHLAKRMKNNVASKKSREKSKTQNRLAEEHCDALEKRHQELVNIKEKLEAAVKTVLKACIPSA